MGIKWVIRLPGHFGHPPCRWISIRIVVQEEAVITCPQSSITATMLTISFLDISLSPAVPVVVLLPKSSRQLSFTTFLWLISVNPLLQVSILATVSRVHCFQSTTARYTFMRIIHASPMVRAPDGSPMVRTPFNLVRDY